MPQEFLEPLLGKQLRHRVGFVEDGKIRKEARLLVD